MNPILKSLEEITAGYSVFEKDQVLTHEQLNSVADYFDDQTRLTRVKLLGVGIVCGLRVSALADKVTVTRGGGVTTDGDLLYLAADTVFDKFKLYDESNPAYAPFRPNDTLIKAYELVPQGTDDPRGTAFSQFGTGTGLALADMVAVAFMESYVKDEDLCSGTDCDNLGQNFINSVKLLLVEKSSAGLLLKQVPLPPADAFAALSEIVAERPLFSSSITTPAQLAAAYRTVCTGLHEKLMTELARIFPNCSSFLGGVFASDPFGGWGTKLKNFEATFTADEGIRLPYYDFLKDLVETCNAFRNLLFGENTWCCPDTNSFPKHLLLGNILAGTDAGGNRTGFYPSPVTSRTSEALERAKFLAGKINTLIQTFARPASTPAPAIRITPSSTEERSLKEQAIPYYYAVNTANPVQMKWNYALSQRGMDAWNYSYNAALFGAQGGAAKPLTSQIGRFSFFRIEGHLGQAVATVTETLEKEIKVRNLPFTVRAVFLGTDRTRIVKNPGGRYSDLHRFHYLLRQDAFHQLDDVVSFSGKFKNQVDAAISTNVVTNSSDGNDSVAVSEIVLEKHGTVTDKSSKARTKLNRSYSAFKADTSWKTDVSDTMKAAGEFKSGLGKVSRTEFTTPFDSLISNTHILWIDWLDDIIKQKDDQADEKLLFSKFVGENPGIEHFAGVPRGGTFVLVYNTDNKVIADFMLDYRSVEEAEPEPAEPPLAKPGWKPSWVIDNGIRINPSIDKYVTGKLNTFTTDVIDPRINLQKDYLGIFKDVAGVFGDTRSGAIVRVATDGIKFTDDVLAAAVGKNRAKQNRLETLREEVLNPELSAAERRRFLEQAKKVEADLGKSAEDLATYVADSAIDVTAGSEGHAALLEVFKSVGMINEPARNSAKTGLKKLRDRVGNGFKTMIDVIIET